MALTFADPTLDGGVSAWTKSSGSAAWSLLDDGIRSPGDARALGDGGFVTSESTNQINVVSFGNTITFVPGSTWTLFVYGSGGTNRALDIQVSNDDGGNWQTRQANVIPAAAAPGWYTLDVGPWIADQGDLDGFRVRLVCSNTGVGTPSVVRVDALYLQQATGAASITGAANLSGTGGSSIAGVRTAIGAASLSGSGSASASGRREALGAAELSGSGAAVASGLREAIGGATLTGGGTLAAAGVSERIGAAALTGGGSLTARGRVERPGGPAFFAPDDLLDGERQLESDVALEPARLTSSIDF